MNVSWKIGLPALFHALGSVTFGASCGTLDAPTSCTLINGDVQYAFSLFSLPASSGARSYAADDIAIDLVASGTGALITFSKVADPSSVFFVNAGETIGFTLQYRVDISSVTPGIPQLIAPGQVSFGPHLAVDSGFASVQMIWTNPPSGETCQAVLNSVNTTTGVCSTLPLSTTTSLIIGNIAVLSAATGNVSFASFSNLLDASFTEDAAPVIPEPATALLSGLGLAAIWWLRRWN